MKLCVLIPALNEEQTIADVINRIPKSIEGINQIIILVIDDGSNDRTKEIAQANGAIVFSHPWTMGLGSAFNTGVNEAINNDVDILITIDADGQFLSEEIPYLVSPIVEGNADFVCGDRFTDNQGKLKKPENMSTLNYWGNLGMSFLISLLINKRFTDVSSGFRAYSQEALLQLNLMGKFNFSQEVFIDLSNKGVAIESLPVSVIYFPDRESRVAKSLSKYATNAIKIIFRSYRDYHPLRFFSWLSLFNFLIGIIFGFLSYRQIINSEMLSRINFFGVIGIYFFSVGTFLIIVGLLADMFVRIRQNQEKILYKLNKQQHTK